MLKALIFDLDGTLINTNKIHVLTFQKAFRKSFGISLKSKEIIPLFGESVGEIVVKILLKHGKKLDRKSIEDFVKLKVKLYVKAVKKKHLLSKASFVFLKKLKNQGFKLAIASGTERRMLNASLKPAEREIFDVLVCANDVKKAKPFPQELNLAVKKLGVKKTECLYIGDGLLDAKAAKNAGLKFVGFLSGITSAKQFKTQKPIMLIKKIPQLSSILGKL